MKKLVRYVILYAAFLLAAFFLYPASAQERKESPVSANVSRVVLDRRSPQQVVKEGIKVEFTIDPLTPSNKNAILAGEDALIRFRITETSTGTPLSGARPAAWLSHRPLPHNPPDDAECRAKIQSFLQGDLRTRPDVDLNSYYILALNQEPNISVIDPLQGFGGSKLVTLVQLKSPGEDWVLTSDGTRLFVATPQSGLVSIIDTKTWKVIASVETGGEPTRVALQPDEKYLWVGLDAPGPQSGVAAIDTAGLKIAARIATGEGHHEIAFSSDNRFVFVTNRAAGTLSVLGIRELARLRDVKTGAPASSLGISPLSKAVYVAGTDGSIAVLDGASHRIVTRIAATPGANHVRFAPGGRWGFLTNPVESVVQIFDASNNRVVNTASVGKNPVSVSFTSTFAYIRSTGSEAVTAIRLSTIGGELDVVKFPGGQLAPEASRNVAATADAIVAAPEGNAVLVANPADRMIYYYSEGMAAPMGNFQNYRREPRAVMVVDRSLRESVPGIYSTSLRPPKSGSYTIPFLLDSPRILHCFEAEAAPNPELKDEKKVALRVEYLNQPRSLRTGEDYSLRFKLFDTTTGQPASDLKDVRVLVFLAPGIWQKRGLAVSVGGGVYELNINPPQAGAYLVFIESRSQDVAFKDLPNLSLLVK